MFPDPIFGNVWQLFFDKITDIERGPFFRSMGPLLFFGKSIVFLQRKNKDHKYITNNFGVTINIVSELTDFIPYKLMFSTLNALKSHGPSDFFRFRRN